ncbi:hypothetical protein GCM10010112_57600 [Actinoplanes lobatus]|uniref:Uncharacterized protein n=1 Tax=Actinoplanes lobatus TaxID=113568 RepID=A0A7W7HCA7_9ACTN|nr:DUF6461 domain-containing protein [Actinoplanes lobatus]MBB4747921.1 hypothetical protein [Actinoplanes lobatus]GGN81300.1 hypothetical protein GCM10010112_57600 [Actinoplanes lobatus]GIE41612.1 hypothetical protein Alo02nite_45100 [Actinoplanes lobatus]
MNRRSALLLFALSGLSGCGSPGFADPLPSAGPDVDLGWPARSADLTHGFCFTLVRGIKPYALIERLGGDELERVEWHRVVGPGDGETGDPKRFFVGIASAGDWSILVEDNGSLGVTSQIVEPLSADGGEVVAYRGGGGGPGRLMVFRDGNLALDLDTAVPERAGGGGLDEFRPELTTAGLLGGGGVTDPTGAALGFMARHTGIALTSQLLRDRTYLLVTVPKP